MKPAVEARASSSRPMDPAAGPITGDPNRLQQIAWNLLSNAIKFTPRAATSRCGSRPSPRASCSRFQDNGPGIDPVFLPTSSSASARPTPRARGRTAAGPRPRDRPTPRRDARRDRRGREPRRRSGAIVWVTSAPAGRADSAGAGDRRDDSRCGRPRVDGPRAFVSRARACSWWTTTGMPARSSSSSWRAAARGCGMAASAAEGLRMLREWPPDAPGRRRDADRGRLLAHRQGPRPSGGRRTEHPPRPSLATPARRTA